MFDVKEMADSIQLTIRKMELKAQLKTLQTLSDKGVITDEQEVELTLYFKAKFSDLINEKDLNNEHMQ